MSKKINKNTTDSEELFKRLETGSDAGLDDFEKEALEGFAALDDVKLSKKLNEELNLKIHETYFKPAAKKNNIAFLSMAAGLLLMVGVSIFFYQYLNGEKSNVALNDAPKTETSVMEKKADPSAEQTNAYSGEEQKELQKTAAVIVDKVAQNQAPKDLREEMPKGDKDVNGEFAKKGKEALADDENVSTTNTGGVASVPAVLADEKFKSQSNDGQLANRRNNSGPAGNAGGNVGGGKDSDKKDLSQGEEKSKNINLAAKEKSPATKSEKQVPSEQESPANSETKSTSDAKSNEDIVVSNKGEGGNYKEEDKSRAKVSSRDASKKRLKKAEAESSPSTSSPAKVSEPGNLSVSFYDSKFSSAQAYVKTEIEKDEVLKDKVKDFKAKLFVDETGKVVKVNFITDFKKCKDCDERLGKILLNMPGWNTIPAQDKNLNRETILSYPK